jgi:hypothetical protein
VRHRPLDKNSALLHLTLARRRGCGCAAASFGDTTACGCWGYRFDHVAIATGAGRPTIIDMKHNLIRGIRKASDFLMALQRPAPSGVRRCRPAGAVPAMSSAAA